MKLSDRSRDRRGLQGLLAAVLWLACAAAQAEWVRIAHNEQSVFYLDPTLSKRVGSHVMVWMLRDHVGQAQGPFRSSKDQLEVDCAGRNVRRIYASDHGQAMGLGPALHFEHGPMSWNRVTPNTILSRMVNIACMAS